MKEKQNNNSIILVAVIIALVVLAGIYAIGYYSADGTPDTIDLTDSQTKTIIREQASLCTKSTRVINKTCDDKLEEKDVLISKLYNYRNILLDGMSTQSKVINEVRDIVFDLNANVSDLNHNIVDLNFNIVDLNGSIGELISK